jgi:hypothetical protein
MPKQTTEQLAALLSEELKDRSKQKARVLDLPIEEGEEVENLNKSPTRLTSPQLDSTQLNSTQLTSSIAPARDYNKRANSIERDALPAGLFPGTSKKLYDALYLRTRGAIKPVRFIQATRSDVMRWAGIGGLNTFLSHVKHLTKVGLIVRTFEVGNQDGAIYEIRLPEELDSTQLASARLNSPKLRSTQIGSTPDRVHDSTQNVSRVESGNPIDNKAVSAQPQTFLKTKDQDDDEAFPELRKAERELTGKESAIREWAEVDAILAAEFRLAASRTNVTSAPGFLAEHLRRRLAKPEPVQVKYTRKTTTTEPVNTKPEPVTDETLDRLWEESADSPTMRAQLLEANPDYFKDRG